MNFNEFKNDDKIGGATAEIGDPSGKTKDRPLLDRFISQLI